MLVKEMVEYDLREQDGLFGLEIEVEGDMLPTNLNKYWRIEMDGSLRGKPQAYEYVLKEPLSETNLDKALKYFKNKLKTNGSYFCDDSTTAGIHVHLNFQNETVVHLFNFVTIYFILESVLLTFCDDRRVGNHFCLDMESADYMLDVITTALTTHNWSHLDDNIRYASMNLTALNKYGSVEFRSLESTSDFNKILTWCKILNTLKENSKKYEDPREIIETFSERSDHFLSDMFGEYSHLFDSHENNMKMYRGMRLAQNIAYCNDWEFYKKGVKENVNPFTGIARGPLNTGVQHGFGRPEPQPGLPRRALRITPRVDPDHRRLYTDSYNRDLDYIKSEIRRGENVPDAIINVAIKKGRMGGRSNLGLRADFSWVFNRIARERGDKFIKLINDICREEEE